MILQQRLLGRRIPPGATLAVVPSCKRPGGTPISPGHGAGDDWRCTLSVIGPGLRQTPITYEVHVRTNGCYTADGPPALVGQPTIRDVHGHQVINPALRFDGCFDTT